MSQRTRVVAGNWKMNGSLASIRELLHGIQQGLTELNEMHSDVLVFPAHVHLGLVLGELAASRIEVGAQDVDSRESGAVTGAVSAGMVSDIGGRYCLVGHSERRTLFDESDEEVAAKFEQCLDAGLTPVLCVGESLAERQAGETLEVVTRQLGAVVEATGAGRFSGALLAYEPVWAIGTGESATPQQAEEVHHALRTFLSEQDENLAEETRILYGGSVTPENAVTLFKQDNVDGALVGGASLKADSFVEICRAAEDG